VDALVVCESAPELATAASTERRTTARSAPRSDLRASVAARGRPGTRPATAGRGPARRPRCPKTARTYHARAGSRRTCPPQAPGHGGLRDAVLGHDGQEGGARLRVEVAHVAT